jgi:hypothetical protein
MKVFLHIQGVFLKASQPKALPWAVVISALLGLRQFFGLIARDEELRECLTL